jgi:predicted O-linked N-acetylglucosamine transferase (SPINDLY family)
MSQSAAAQAAFRGGDLEQAENLARQAADSGETDAHALLARILSQTGDLDGAENHAQTALDYRPDDAVTMAYLGAILMAKGQEGDAVAAFRRAVDLRPGDAVLLNEYGNALAATGRGQEAITVLRQAVSVRDDIPEIHNNLGNVLRTAGRLTEAADCYRTALTLRPIYPEALNNLGVVMQEQGNIDSAIDALSQAIAIDPDNALLHTHLGTAYAAVGRLSDAVEAHRKALTLDPDLAAAQNNLGIALKDQGLLDEARDAYTRSLEIEPDAPEVHSNLLMCLSYDPAVDGASLLAAHRAWAAKHERPVAAAFDRTAEPDRVLRIGYVSPDFWTHSVAYFIEPALEYYDRDRFHVTCYADVERPDATTARLRDYVDRWHETAALSDDELFDLIRADGIDILIDLAGHTANNRLPVFGRRAAPLQMSWIGYPATTGLAQMDYRVTDEWADPAGETDAYHSETLLRLQRGFLCYTPPADAPAPAADRGDRPITFGSFNNLSKVTDAVIALWSEILHEVPDARLLLKSRQLADEGVRRRIVDAFAEHLIPEERLDLHGRLASRGAHLELYGAVDVALDTFPYNGTTTTCEALWMGVPVVTMAGDLHAGRVGASLLHQCGLDDWVAATPENYVSLALAIAANLPERRILREWVAESGLTDGPAFAVAWEEALREVWRDLCAASGEIASR